MSSNKLTSPGSPGKPRSPFSPWKHKVHYFPACRIPPWTCYRTHLGSFDAWRAEEATIARVTLETHTVGTRLLSLIRTFIYFLHSVSLACYLCSQLPRDPILPRFTLKWHVGAASHQFRFLIETVVDLSEADTNFGSGLTSGPGSPRSPGAPLTPAVPGAPYIGNNHTHGFIQSQQDEHQGLPLQGGVRQE